MSSLRALLAFVRARAVSIAIDVLGRAALREALLASERRTEEREAEARTGWRKRGVCECGIPFYEPVPWRERGVCECGIPFYEPVRPTYPCWDRHRKLCMCGAHLDEPAVNGCHAAHAVYASRCWPGDECGRPGCPECQQ